MIVEHRTYSFQPGTIEGWLEKYETEGLPVQKKHLGKFLGLYISEIGRLHQTVMIWAYESHADRETRRAAMYADADWKAFTESVGPVNMMVTQEVMIMTPAPCSPPVEL